MLHVPTGLFLFFHFFFFFHSYAHLYNRHDRHRFLALISSVFAHRKRIEKKSPNLGDFLRTRGTCVATAVIERTGKRTRGTVQREK